MDKARDFWTMFGKRARKWANLLHSGRTQEAFEDIDRVLSDRGYDFPFDLTSDDEHCIITFSPEGDPELASEIDTLVKSAPTIVGWQIFGRRQRKELADAYAIVANLYDADVSQATFQILKHRGDIQVVMYFPNAKQLGEDEQAALVATFLDHAVGEDLVMSRSIRSRLKPSRPPSELRVLSAPELIDKLLKDKD
jgi:hypothetical protein